MKRMLVVLLCISLALACNRPMEQIPPAIQLTTKESKLIIYQVMTRLFGNKISTNKTYGTIEENGVGKFNDITKEALQGIKELGVTHVWYTGVLEHAVLTDYTEYNIPLDDADVVKGRAGSPYAIKDYYDVNPDLAVDVTNRMHEFEQLIERTHAQKLKVIIDFVPNHVARGYKSDALPDGVLDLGSKDDKSKSFHPNNNFYYLPGQRFMVPEDYESLGPDQSFSTKDGMFDEYPAKVTGNDQFTASPSVHDWFETVKLNYGVDYEDERKKYFDPVPDTWIKMKDILVFWAKKGVDGFRCDMAEMVPVEFWAWAIPQVKEVNKELIFIAEIYNPLEYHNYIKTGRFDFLYDKVQLYDTLRLLINDKSSTLHINEIQQSLRGINQHMLHFLENHDEQRIASDFFAGDPWKAIPAMVISAMIDQGPVMIYFGQEVGEPGLGVEGFQGEDGRTTIFDYWGVPEHQKWMNDGRFDGVRLSDDQKKLRKVYTDLLQLAANQSAIVKGNYIDLTESNLKAGNIPETCHVFARYVDEQTLLIVSGFNSQQQDIRIAISNDEASKMGLSINKDYKLIDLLGQELQVHIRDLYLELSLPPYTSYVFNLQEN
jgi:glycosidase